MDGVLPVLGSDLHGFGQAPGQPIACVFAGCAGWLHLSHNGAGGSAGVILCGPVGHEALAAHRGWRDLGQGLAAAGLTTLRFDYPGTGDSAGDDQGPECIERWVDSIVAAAAFLRAECGVTRISLVGLRLGATLAARASARIGDVSTLACLNPVLSGWAYIREMTLLANTWWAQAAPDHHCLETAPGCLDVIGTRWSAEALAGLKAIDLIKLSSWPPKVVLMESSGRPDVAALATNLRARDTEVMETGFPGATILLEDALRSETPVQAFDTLCALLADRGPASGQRNVQAPPQSLVGPDYFETPLRFGPDRVLHGVLCQARTTAAPRIDASVVVILNTGLTHHVGHARLAVLLARNLAARGVASLRMDGAGIGDSDLPPGQDAPRLHDTRSCDDVTAAIDVLKQRGAHDVTILGMCSGGHQAFHATLADPRIDRLIVVNMQKFKWVGGPTAYVSYDGNRRATKIYLRAALSRAKWQSALRGEIDVLRIGTDLLRRSIRTFRHKALQRIERLTGIETKAGQVERWLRALSARGVEVCLFYSDADPGLADLRFEIAYPGPLERLPGLSIEVMANADHTLSSILARDRFLARVQHHIASDPSGNTSRPVPT